MTRSQPEGRVDEGTGEDERSVRLPKRRLPPDVRRLQIVEAAAVFFAEVGLEGRTRDLSGRLGITQSLLYKYFSSKEELLEAVFEHVYLGRLSPSWPSLIKNRAIPLRQRIIQFYVEYTRAIFTYEWMRIFMFSGLASEQLNRRYLGHLSELLLTPMLEEIRAAPGEAREVEMEDIWNLHGGIVYTGIRKFIYQTPTPEDVEPLIEKAVDRLLGDLGISRDDIGADFQLGRENHEADGKPGEDLI